VTIGGIKTLQAKPGKDCYLVRAQSKRSTGLPDARTITATPIAKTITVSAKKTVDEKTMLLMRDLNLGTISYTRSSIVGNALPTQGAIDDARIFLGEAKKRLVHLGDDVRVQVQDKDLKSLTAQVYSRIPKVKALRAAPETWILNKDNITGWEQDLDAYESALSAEASTNEYDPFVGLDVRVEYCDEKNRVGQHIRQWLPSATNNRNDNFGTMKVLHVWKVDHPKAEDKFAEMVRSIKVKSKERPSFQPPERYDIDLAKHKLYQQSNTCWLFHASRSVNIAGILKSRLRLPKELVGVTITGSLLGEGAYSACDWKKSAQYSSHPNALYTRSNPGRISGRTAFIFVADVILGDMHVAPQAYGFTSPPSGYHSVMGKAGFTHGNRGQLINDEFVVYNEYQIQLRYLVEFDVTSRW